MSAQNNEEDKHEGNNNQQTSRDPKHHNESNSMTHVLKTMINLIVELQTFKADNEKLKKAQEEQQEINDILL
jgi:hypothetical protein